YSPNSRRDVQLPPVYDEIPYCDCFKHGFAEFHQPLWWQPACPYLAFLPLRPDIRDAVELLLTHERAPPITWIAPTSISCTGAFRRVHDLRAHFMHSREWFSQFMGGFSYAIAVSITLHHDNLHQGVPHWFSFLSERGYSQIWLSGVMSSIVATFDSSVNRAGVFVHSAIIPSWKAFFEKCQARNEHLKARETDKQRQSRESREKNPPVKRTKVFLWKRIEGGGYRRESFYQAENGMHLDAYNKCQKIYDAFSNEWDCCSEFGEPSQGDFADDDD
ncbi:hypothetical protein BYT27DRAFT_7059341, partial [Phlegmacium glaucopus]